MKLDIKVPDTAFFNLRAIMEATAFDENQSAELALHMAFGLYRILIHNRKARVMVPLASKPSKGYAIKMFPRPLNISDDEVKVRTPLRLEVGDVAANKLTALAKHFKISEANMLWGALQLMADIVQTMADAETRKIVVVLPCGTIVRGDLEHPPEIKKK